MKTATKWEVTVGTGEQADVYEVYGRPNLTPEWAMFLVRGDDGTQLITAAFPTRNVTSVIVNNG